MTNRILLTLAMAGVLSAATSAVAAPPPGTAPPADWKACDGYGGPSKSGDGMTTYASALRIFVTATGGDMVRSQTGAGQAGLAACDRTLADPILAPAYWMRRVSLLQGRALHQLAANDPRGALETLDLAQQTARPGTELYYPRSLGLSLTYVRAYALGMMGDRSQAWALATESRRWRPYSRQTAIATTVLMGRSGTRADVRAALQAQARLDPQRIDGLFVEAVEAGRWNEAIALYPSLSPRLKPANRPMYDFQEADLNIENRTTTEVYWASRSGAYAVALAETGRVPEARAAIAQARDRVARAASAPPDLMVNGKPVKSKWLPNVALRANQAIGQRGGAALDRAAYAVEALAAGERRQAEITGPARPLGRPEEELGLLLTTLPGAETMARIPVYAPFHFGPWVGDKPGYSEKPGPAPGVTTVMYRSSIASPDAVEEMAVMRAADLARQAGRAGFVILARRDTQHSITNTYYTVPVASFPDGYSTELDVVFVDPQSLPPEFRATPWRVIDAETAFSALARDYPPPVAGRR